MELPIGFRVSGPFLRKGPIIEEGPLAEPKGPLERGLGTRPRVYMRGDYYVVPPEWRAYTHVCTHVSKDCAHHVGLILRRGELYNWLRNITSD